MESQQIGKRHIILEIMSLQKAKFQNARRILMLSQKDPSSFATVMGRRMSASEAKRIVDSAMKRIREVDG